MKKEQKGMCIHVYHILKMVLYYLYSYTNIVL